MAANNSAPSSNGVAELLARLAECPVNSTLLWRAYWGDDEKSEQPGNVIRIARDIVGATYSRVVLVHGRYGTGKSSFMRCLQQQLQRAAEESADDVVVFDDWLDMPSLTSRIGSSALAATMARIAETLGEVGRNTGLETGQFSAAVDDLWRLEAIAGREECIDPCDCTRPPEQNRMAGAIRSTARRTLRANELEKTFDRYLEYMERRDGTHDEKRCRRSFVVFLDDLDRCEYDVPYHMVRLLLRFGATHRIHFVLACDWDVLEQGVKDWMRHHGRNSDGRPLVTANSALAKYIHMPVQVPSMGMPVAEGWESIREGRRLDIRWREHMERIGGIVKVGDGNSAYTRPMLADALIGELLGDFGAMVGGGELQP